jgi:hypothetical protein
MTENTPPKLELSWEPIQEGIALWVNFQPFKLNMNDVRELQTDMHDAMMLSSGYEKIEVFSQDIEIGDRFRVFGLTYTIDNVLVQHATLPAKLTQSEHPLRGEQEVVLQSNWRPGEFTVPYDELLEVYRRIE